MLHLSFIFFVASCPDLGLSVSTRPRYPTVGPEEDPLYRPVPNDPFWYHKENDNKLDTKDRKSPTRKYISSIIFSYENRIYSLNQKLQSLFFNTFL